MVLDRDPKLSENSTLHPLYRGYVNCQNVHLWAIMTSFIKEAKVVKCCAPDTDIPVWAEMLTKHVWSHMYWTSHTRLQMQTKMNFKQKLTVSEPCHCHQQDR